MDAVRLAQLLKSKASLAMNDYSQLENVYPNAKKFASALRNNIEQHIPSNADFNSPQKMGEWSLNTALNQPSGLVTRALELYHGGNDIVPKVEKSGLFNGLFLSPDKDAALSHGDVISKYYVNKNKIGDDFGDKYEDTIKLIKDKYPHATDSDIENVLYPSIAEDKSPWEMDHNEILNLLGFDDMADAAWHLQSSRGEIGKKLGYDAIKMNDEHGDSYFIPFGSKAKFRENK